MFVFSVRCPNLFPLRRFFCTFFSTLLILLFFLLFLGSIPPAPAWNPDAAYGLPKQRRMCVKRLPQGRIAFNSIASDEDCPPGETRYVVIFAKEPRGALALVKSTTSQKFYPPLSVQWPARKDSTRTSLWHFTCVGEEVWEILGSDLEMLKYKGELTSPQKDSSCSEAEVRALQYCQEHLGGESLLETCSLSWGR